MLNESETMQHLLTLAKHKSKAKSVISKCTKCDFTGIARGLNIHYSRQHRSADNITTEATTLKRFERQCTLCKKTIRQKNVKRHLQISHGLKEFELRINLNLISQRSPTSLVTSKCRICEYIGTAVGLRLHYKEKHWDECSADSLAQLNEISENAVLLIHRHGNQGYTCTLCLKEFKTRSIIVDHLLRDHSHTIAQLNDVFFECDLCPRLFSSFENFEVHQKNNHVFKQNKQFLCHYCGKSKQSKRALEYHIASHINLRQFTCDICQKGFNEKSVLSAHMSTHSKQRPYVCNIQGCRAAYSQKFKLYEHNIVRHSTEKRYQCDICGKKFKLQRYLK